MKFTHTLVCLAIALLLLPTASYAIVDFGMYGGYTFAGKIDNPTISNADTNGWQYGFIGHLNGSVIPMVLSMGIGGFYQKSPLQYTVAGKDFDLTKTMYGIDAIVMLELPILIHPYARAGIAINEKVELKTPLGTLSDEKKFNSYYFGLGAAFTVFPFVQIFGEYLYNYSKLEDDGTLKSNSINVGARLNI
ncbi:MAG: porin family protein [Spirochaetes bacterium]|nr:porin family protein [Spirochaetota bacterium]